MDLYKIMDGKSVINVRINYISTAAITAGKKIRADLAIYLHRGQIAGEFGRNIYGIKPEYVFTNPGIRSNPDVHERDPDTPDPRIMAALKKIRTIGAKIRARILKNPDKMPG